jgi:hypothetical protein
MLLQTMVAPNLQAAVESTDGAGGVPETAMAPATGK